MGMLTKNVSFLAYLSEVVKLVLFVACGCGGGKIMSGSIRL